MQILTGLEAMGNESPGSIFWNLTFSRSTLDICIVAAAVDNIGIASRSSSLRAFWHKMGDWRLGYREVLIDSQAARFTKISTRLDIFFAVLETGSV